MIEAASISHSLGGRQVLSDVSFTAQGGEHIALVGPNGAGKSTLLQILAGLIQPDDGSIVLQGQLLPELDLTSRARSLSYLPQHRELAWDLLVEDVAALGRFAWGGRRYQDLTASAQAPINEALEKTGASAFLGRPVKSLSGGEQARVHMARALAGGGDVLLLDEPFAALDLKHQLELMGVLEDTRKAGQLVVTILHDLDLAERFATRLIVLDQGCVKYDGAASLSGDTLGSVFGLTRRDGGGFDAV